jgi:hypothetical protein
MGRGIINRLIGSLEDAAAKLPDKRGVSNDRKYELADALKTGLAVFYTLNPSLLAFQEAMKKKYKRSNLETLFRVKEIPSSNQLKTLVDGIEPYGLEEVFDAGLRAGEDGGVAARYRVLDGEVPVVCDGTWYFSSKDIHCKHCLRIREKKKDGSEDITWYHDMLAFAIVRYDSSVVLPLAPEFIRNEDGGKKQDCERNAMKRYIARRSERLRELKPLFLGDDLYSCHSIESDLDGRGFSFIFTCKEESHPWIAEQTSEGAPFEEYTRTEWNGRNHLEHRYHWLNGVENRADPDFMRVNYLKYEIWNVEKQEITYHNTWVTNKTITSANVVEMAKVGRSRWKIENEHNNVLKHHGYNLKHNFGHGENHACEIFCMLNLLSFLIHGLQDLADDEYKQARSAFSRRDEFFAALRTETSFHLHTNWSELLNLLAGVDPDG